MGRFFGTHRDHFSSRVRAAAALSVACTAAALALPFTPASAAANPTFKLISNFVGEWPPDTLMFEQVVGLSINGVPQVTLLAELSNPPAPPREVVTPQLTVPAGNVNFAESFGTVDLGDYVSTVECQVHIVGQTPTTFSPTWDDVTHLGSLTLPMDANGVCFITNTRKPADLSITKTVTEASVKPGDTAHFTITVTNIGKSTATAVAVTDPAVGTISGCTIGGVATANPAPALAAGASLVCPAPFVVPANFVGNIVTNTATVTSPSDATPPPAATASVPVARFSFDKSLAVATFAIGGDVLNYTFTVVNTGGAPITALNIADAKITGGYSCKVDAIATTLPTTLAVGKTLVCTAGYVTVAGDVTAGTVVNTATASTTNAASQTDTVTANYVAVAKPDLTITKTLLTGVATNASATWRIVVKNLGAGAQTGVTVSDSLPDNLTFVSGGGTSWACAAVLKVVTCNFSGTATPGATLPNLDIITLVTAKGGETVANGASVAGALADTNLANNTSAASAVVPADVVGSSGPLPATGSKATTIALYAAAVLGFGLVLIAITRRRAQLGMSASGSSFNRESF